MTSDKKNVEPFPKNCAAHFCARTPIRLRLYIFAVKYFRLLNWNRPNPTGQSQSSKKSNRAFSAKTDNKAQMSCLPKTLDQHMSSRQA